MGNFVCVAITVLLSVINVLLRMISWVGVLPFVGIAEGLRWMWVIPTSFIVANLMLCSSYTQSLIVDRSLSLLYTALTTVFAISSACVCFLMLNMIRQSQEMYRTQGDLQVMDVVLATEAKRFEELTHYMDEVRVAREMLDCGHGFMRHAG